MAQNANEARDRSRAPLSLALTRDRFGDCRSGWEVTERFRCRTAIARRFIWAAPPRPKPVGGLSVATVPAVREDRQSSFARPCGRRSFPRGRRRSAAGSRGKIRTVADGAACCVGSGPDRSRFRLRRTACAGGCPAGFSPPRVTPFPSGPKTFRRGVAASARAASGVRILSAFQ